MRRRKILAHLSNTAHYLTHVSSVSKTLRNDYIDLSQMKTN